MQVLKSGDGGTNLHVNVSVVFPSQVRTVGDDVAIVEREGATVFSGGERGPGPTAVQGVAILGHRSDIAEGLWEPLAAAGWLTGLQRSHTGSSGVFVTARTVDLDGLDDTAQRTIRVRFWGG